MQAHSCLAHVSSPALASQQVSGRQATHQWPRVLECACMLHCQCLLLCCAQWQCIGWIRLAKAGAKASSSVGRRQDSLFQVTGLPAASAPIQSSPAEPRCVVCLSGVPCQVAPCRTSAMCRAGTWLCQLHCPTQRPLSCNLPCVPHVQGLFCRIWNCCAVVLIFLLVFYLPILIAYFNEPEQWWVLVC